jgi:hypothetical protein
VVFGYAVELSSGDIRETLICGKTLVPAVFAGSRQRMARLSRQASQRECDGAQPEGLCADARPVPDSGAYRVTWWIAAFDAVTGEPA